MQEILKQFPLRFVSVTIPSWSRISLVFQGLQEGMRMRPLPNTDTYVSELCLGTMMFGDQVKKSDAIQQLDYATKEYGINFIVKQLL
jgi:hypothetical protein